MSAALAGSMAERTGRILAEWVELVRAAGPDPLDRNAVRAGLRDAHGVKQNTRWAIAGEAARAAGWREPTFEEHVDAQYAGTRAALRPIYDRRAARVELGLRFDDPPASARLEPAKAPGQATHRVVLRGPVEVDVEVEFLLRAAYEQNG
ncbi:hypothetical protein SAMN05444320_101508 [Streptoalloteichus hindustanus]|uniref:DUF5655 domain-containing protein n=2 Tax=Streptoalloteichus hindustanus TaxID=2017 RepID=A0A1M4UQ00_STRHI|nr:hypothetical protein SAMN05444320_101508 [Streptoalloteichus hindustanus]